MLPVGTTLQSGKYRIDRYLSSGGFGNTYVATNVFFDEQVAIKEFFLKGISGRDGESMTVSVSIPTNRQQFQEQNEKFKKEAYRLRKLKNDHIVTVHDLFDENGTTYYVMDFIEGESLSARLKRTATPIGEAEALNILQQVLDALDAVHQHGIFHLDIKPANIMVDANGHATLIDFGASKQTKQDGGATTSTGLCYTPGYAPIEQMSQNLSQFGPWTDIYSLGASLYYILTLHPLPSPAELLEDDGALVMDDSISQCTQQLIRRMMTPIRTKRPQSVAEVKALMEATPMPKPPKNITQPESEETVILTPQAPTTDEETQVITPQEPKTPVQPQPTPEPNSPMEPEPTPEPTAYDDEEASTSPKKLIGIIAAVAVVAVIMGAVFLLPGKEEAPAAPTPSEIAQTAADATANNQAQQPTKRPQQTVIENYQTSVGKCRYEGEVNADGVPHGTGKATFADGRSYAGHFVNGKMEGEGVFLMKSGDKFEGEIKDNFFLKGRYITNDGSYFEGTFEKGNPKDGIWYDKNGNKIAQ